MTTRWQKQAPWAEDISKNGTRGTILSKIIFYGRLDFQTIVENTRRSENTIHRHLRSLVHQGRIQETELNVFIPAINNTPHKA